MKLDAKVITEAIEDLDQLWQRLVPRSSRPANKGLYDRIRRQLEKAALAALHADVTADSGGVDEDVEGDGDGDGDEDEPQLVAVMHVMRTLTSEQWEQVQILMRMRRLSDVGRAELFYELGESHHTDCGMELDPDDPHDDCPAAEEDEPKKENENESSEANGASSEQSAAALAESLSNAGPGAGKLVE